MSNIGSFCAHCDWFKPLPQLQPPDNRSKWVLSRFPPNETFSVFLWSSYKSKSESRTRSTVGTRTACFFSRSAKLHSRFQTDSSRKISARHNKVLPNSTLTIAPRYLRSNNSVSPSGFPQRELRNTKHVVIVWFPEGKA